MERKKWLETFLWLADNNRPGIEYRKRLRVMHAQLPKLIKRIPAYRKELAAILEAERVEQERLKAEDERRRREQAEREAERESEALRLAARDSSEGESGEDSVGELELESGLQESTGESSIESPPSQHDEDLDAERDS